MACVFYVARLHLCHVHIRHTVQQALTPTQTHTYVYAKNRIRVYLYPYLHVYLSMHGYIHTHTHSYSIAYVHPLNISILIRTHTHMHTYTNTYIHSKVRAVLNVSCPVLHWSLLGYICFMIFMLEASTVSSRMAARLTEASSGHQHHRSCSPAQHMLGLRHCWTAYL